MGAALNEHAHPKTVALGDFEKPELGTNLLAFCLAAFGIGGAGPVVGFLELMLWLGHLCLPIVFLRVFAISAGRPAGPYRQASR